MVVAEKYKAKQAERKRQEKERAKEYRTELRRERREEKKRELEELRELTGLRKGDRREEWLLRRLLGKSACLAWLKVSGGGEITC